MVLYFAGPMGLWANVALAVRLKGIKEISAASAGIQTAGRTQAHLVDATRIIVDAREVGLLDSIDP